MQNIKLAPGQSIFDVLLIYSGGISSLFDALKASGLDELDLPEGTIIQVPTVINADVIKALSSELATGTNNIFTGTIEGTTVSVTAKNTALTPIGSGVYSVGTSGEMLIDDTYVEVNGTAIIQFPSASFKSLAIVNGSGVELPILDATSETISVDAGGGSGTNTKTAKVMQTGLTISMYPDDDGGTQRGRTTDFFTLSELNAFGNYYRFTDILGGQDYEIPIVLDWSTDDGVETLAYWNQLDFVGSWTALVNYIPTVNIGGFLNWSLINAKEGINIMNYGRVNCLNYFPFNFGLNPLGNLNGYFHTSTYWVAKAIIALKLYTPYGGLIGDPIDNGAYGIPVRNFSRSELGL